MRLPIPTTQISSLLIAAALMVVSVGCKPPAPPEINIEISQGEPSGSNTTAAVETPSNTTAASETPISETPAE